MDGLALLTQPSALPTAGTPPARSPKWLYNPGKTSLSQLGRWRNVVSAPAAKPTTAR